MGTQPLVQCSFWGYPSLWSHVLFRVYTSAGPRGYPRTGVPPGQDRTGVPPSQERTGIPPPWPGQDWGTPPSQDRSGVPPSPPTKTGLGYLWPGQDWGTPLWLGLGYPPPRRRTFSFPPMFFKQSYKNVEKKTLTLLCKILCLHVLIFCSFMNKAFTAKAVVVCVM